MNAPMPTLVQAEDTAALVNALAELEGAIVARLKAALTPAGREHPVVDVQSWPDAPQSYRMSHPVGTVLVIYQGFTTRDGHGGLLEVSHSFGVRVLARTLRDASVPSAEARAGTGTYQLLQICRLALLGFVPQAGCDPMQIQRGAFDDYQDGVWHYELTATTRTAWLVPQLCTPGPWAFDGPNACCDTAPPTRRVDFADGAGQVAANRFLPEIPETQPQEATP